MKTHKYLMGLFLINGLPFACQPSMIREKNDVQMKIPVLNVLELVEDGNPSAAVSFRHKRMILCLSLK